MTNMTIKAALLGTALLLSAFTAYAENGRGASPAVDAKTTSKALKTANATQPIDINSASKAQLKTIPGITDALAGKIIAGRPYLTKAHLVTHNIIPLSQYVRIKDLVVARQK